MTVVTVNFYGQLKDLSGKKHLKISAETFKDLIFHIRNKFPEKFIDFLLTEDYKINNTISILLNDKPVEINKNFDYKFRPKDAVHFIPPVVGG